MIDINKKFQKRISDSLEAIAKDNTASSYMRIADEDLKTIEEKGIQAGILSNYKRRVMDSDEGRSFMTTNNYGPYLPELWPIITAWYPEFPLKELISVQDMEQDLAYIITSELLAGTNKAGTAIGDKVETPSGPRTIQGKYPTGEIFGEELTADDLVFSTDTVGALAYFPIMTDADALELLKVSATIGGVKYSDWVVASVVSGVITMTSALASGSLEIEVATGVITFEDAEVTAATVSYQWNIEYANDDNIPTVVEDMKMVPLMAKPRVIAMKWTVFSEYLKKKQFGIDIRTQTTKRVLDLMYQYQVRYILDKMYNGATGTPDTITVPSTAGVDLNVRVQQVLMALNKVSQNVQAATGRIEGNQLVVGNTVKSYFESLPDTYFKPEAKGKDYGFNGPRKIGTIGRFQVYYDNSLGDLKAWMTYRGNEWYDAAFYMGVFLPLAPTDAINININVRQAFVEMVAYKLDKPAAIIPLTFSFPDPE